MRGTELWMTAIAGLLLVPAGALAKPVDETVPCDKDGVVRVSNVAGSIRIETHDAAEVRVTGTADEKVEDVSVTADGGDVEIEVKLPRRMRGEGGDADLVVAVPRRAEVKVETVSANIESAGTEGELGLESVSGTVKVRDAKGSVDVATVSGDVDVDGVDAEVDIESVSGKLTIHPAGHPVSAETTSGRIVIPEGPVTSLDCTSVSGDIEIALGSAAKHAELDVENFSGGILVTMPAGAGATVSVESFSGAIRTDFDGDVRHEQVGPGSSLEETWGDGSMRLDLSTFSGRVDIRKAGKARAESGE